MLFVFNARNKTEFRIKTNIIIWIMFNPNNLTLIINTKGNCFWTTLGTKISKNSIAVKEAMESTLVFSKKLTYDIPVLINISSIAFRSAKV